jgi:integrase
MNFAGGTQAGKDRRSSVAKGIKQLCERANVPYLSPHKIRHSHAVYALKQADDVAAAKAISQNLMHASLTTTESIYGVLTESDVKERISALTHEDTLSTDISLAVLADRLIAQLLDRSEIFADAIVNAVAQRFALQIEGTHDNRMPSSVGAPGFEPGTSTTPL